MKCLIQTHRRCKNTKKECELAAELIMEKLPMRRVCLGEDIRMVSIVGTHLQEIYESLVLMPFETTDGRPLLVCYICRAMLQNCYDLRKSCLQSEELFTQMLSCNEIEQVKLQAINNKKRLTIHNTVEWILGMDADNVGVVALNHEVQDNVEDVDNAVLEEKSVSDNMLSADLDDDFLITVKEEQIGYNANIDSYDMGTRGVPDDVLPADSDNKNEESMEPELEMDADSDGVETLVLLCDVKDEPNDSKDFSGDVLKGSSISDNVLSTVSNSKIENSMGILNMDSDNVGVQTVVFDVNDGHSDPEDILKNALKRPNILPAIPDNNFVITVKKQIGRETVDPARKNSTQDDQWNAEDSTSTGLKYHILIQNTSQDLLSNVTHATQKPHQCNICHRRFQKRRYLRSHMHTHTAVKPYQCNVCKKRFGSEMSMRRHIKIHVDTPFQCHICEKVFSIESSLKIHMRTHTGEKPYRCDICSSQFAAQGSLSRHMRSHTGEKIFHCDVCPKKYTTKDSLIYHKRTHNKGKPKITECTICNNHFECENELKLHIHTHATAKTFLCEICNTVLTHKVILRKHMRGHTSVQPKPFRCEICKKKFTIRFALKSHMRTHTGEKPFHCHICNRQFGQKRYLTQHLLIKTCLK